MPRPALKPGPYWLVAASALAGALPVAVLYPLGTEGALALMWLSAWTLLPAVCALMPYWAVRRGAEKYAAFWPPPLGCLASWLAVLLPPPWLAIGISFLISVVASVAGEESRRRSIGQPPSQRSIR